MSSNPKIYMDSCCFIEMARHAIGRHQADREDDIWYLKKLLEAARAGEIAVYTAMLTVNECQHADGIVDDEVKSLFDGMLLSGQYVFLVQDSVLLAQRGRDIRWVHGISLRGPDSIHVASALEMGCSELITTDGKLYRRAEELQQLGIRVIFARETQHLPEKYRQERFDGI